jgi:hypothetical protein
MHQMLLWPCREWNSRSGAAGTEAFSTGMPLINGEDEEEDADAADRAGHEERDCR